MSKRRQELVRTTITLPRSLKDKMEKFDENWSELIRETIRQRIEEEGEPDVAEALILNERVKRRAPAGWNSLQVIKQWRRRTSS